ncbi:uncharacterized protein [Temnothorax nylanderi]|uniref:uncharacterized protein isoform X1 n=1 Tax=Temnothorax nylanderi TaxID=102681 RepID=UPI003A87ED2F
MSMKFKRFVNLSERHKRRRLSVISGHRRGFVSIAQDFDGSNSSTLEDVSENEPGTIRNNQEQSTDDDDEQTSDRGEEVEDSEEEAADGESTEEEEEEDHDENNEEEVGYDNIEEHNNTSSSSEDENDNVLQNLADMKKRILKNTFLATNLKHKQGNVLLKTLREFPFNLLCLPKDTRTLLKTPTTVATTQVQQIPGGEYLHMGLKCTLKKKLQNLPEDMLPETIEIDFSTDGAEMHRSGTDQFWPIQYRILNLIDKKPVIAGVFKRKQKPSNAFDFFAQFVQEIVDIREEGGIFIRNRQLPLNVRCFIADAPARAFALNHYGHTSSNACSKCKVQGHRCEEPGFRGAMIFPGIRHPPRTDEEYRDMIDEDHHKGRSPLSPVLGLVKQVPFESLHLVYIGNVKKVFSAHIHGKYGPQKLNVRQLNILDSRMTALTSYCPTEFNRRPNKLSMFHHFKGTEFRQLLLYTAPAVLQNVFSEEYYHHFILLHCVMRLLSFENVAEEIYAFCQEALETYVNMCEQLYGEQFLSYNVHGLLHIVDDVRQLGSLETFSAFCYENNMPEFRKHIRKPHLALQQFYKRMCELNDFSFAHVDNRIQICCSKPHAEGPLVEHIPVCRCQQFRKLQVGEITFSTSMRDNCIFLQNSKVCLITNIVQIERNIFFIVQKFRTQVALYDVGLTSDFVGVYHCSNLSHAVEAVNLIDVKGKMYRMPKWSGVEGQEECVLANEWICVSLLTPLIVPQN